MIYKYVKVPPRFIVFVFTALLISLIVIGGFNIVNNSKTKAATAPNDPSLGQASKPYMGWSTWSLQSSSYSGLNTQGNYSWQTEAHVLANADVVHAKLQSHGYNYINIDAGWWFSWNWTPGYDQYARQTTNLQRFPDGMAYVANYIHNYGLKVGIYMPAGLEKGAYNGGNSPIFGSTTCHTKDIVYADLRTTNGWDSAYKLDFSNPCAQIWVDSMVSLFDSWGIDFLKLDGVGPGSSKSGPNYDNSTDVAAWSNSIVKSGHPMQFMISWSLDINNAAVWTKYANSSRIATDVECYCSTLVSWSNSVRVPFSAVIPWIQYAKPGYWNNLDSLDVANPTMDGINNDERQTYMTFWAIEAAPLYSGDDLTRSNTDFSLLTNDEVIGVDQQAIPAVPVSTASSSQVWYIKNTDGSYTVALLNLADGSTATVAANWSDLGFTGSATVHDMWSHTDLGSFTNTFSATLNSHGSRLLKVTPGPGATVLPTPPPTSTPAPTNTPAPSPTPGPLPTPTGTGTSYEAESSTNTLGGSAVVASCTYCSGAKNVGYLGSGGTLQFNNINVATTGTYTVYLDYVDADSGRSVNMSINGGAASVINVLGSNTGDWNTPQRMALQLNLNAGNNTIFFSNSAAYAPDIDRLFIASGSPATATPTKTPGPSATNTPVAGTSTPNPPTPTPVAGNSVSIINMSFNPANLSVNAGTTVTWKNNDTMNHTVTSDTGLFDSGSLAPGATFSFTFSQAGSYNYHCNIHPTIMHGTVTVSGAVPTPTNTPVAATPTNTPGATATKTPAPSSGSYEAESSVNTLSGNARIATCSVCSGGAKVGYIGGSGNGVVKFNNVNASTARTYTLTLYYIDGSSGRHMTMSVNGGSGIGFSTHGTNNNNWNFLQSMTLTITLNAGNNTIKFYDAGNAADIDRITIQ